MTLLLSFAVFVPKLLIGFEIANRVWKERTFAAVLMKLAIGVPIGLWLSSSVFFLALLAGVPPQTYSSIEFGIGVALAILPALRIIALRKTWWKSDNASLQALFPAGILAVGLLFVAGTFLYYARLHPYGFEDAWSIWNLTARYIFRSNSADVFINSEFYPRFHPDYPVEVGLNVAWGWFVLNSETTRIPMVVAFLAVCTPAFLLWAALRRWKSSWAGALGALILSVTPDLPSAVGQYADALLALHMVGAAVMLYEYFHSKKPGLLILAGGLAGSAAWVKNEGLLFLAVFFAVCFLAAWKSDINRKEFPWLIIGAMLPLAIVILYKLTVNAQNDLFMYNGPIIGQILDRSRWQMIGWNFVTYFLAFGNWPISAVLVLFIYTLLTGITTQPSPRSAWLSTLELGQLAGYFFVYLITPYDLQTHIDTSIDRLLSHVFPLIVLWLFSLFRLPDEQTGRVDDMDVTCFPSRKRKNGW